MEDLITKLADLNRKDPDWDYSVEIKPSGAFVLHGVATKEQFVDESKRIFTKRIPCKDCQALRTEMYRIILKLRE